MRLSRFILMLGIIVPLAWAGPTHAQNVLLPSDNNAGPAAPSGDLGLSPDQPASGTSNADSGDKDEAPPTPLPAAAPAPKAASPAGLLPFTPMPPATRPLALSIGTPTRVIQVPVDQPSPANAALPNSFEIDIADGYVWGPFDTNAIKTRLGIPPDQVSAHCRLSAGGTAGSTASTYLINPAPAGNTGFRYDGALTGIHLMAMALCDLVPLPPNLGYVTQYGDRYEVMLAGVSCPPPTPGATRLVLHYAGNGKSICAYQ